MQRDLLLASFLLIALCTVVQKTVFTHQIEASTNPKRTALESIIVPDETTGKTTIVLHNNDKVEYLMLNNYLEIESRIRPANGLLSTIFQKGYSEYLAGVNNNKGSCFFYEIDRNHINMETVDFKNNTVVNSQVLEMPDEERTIQEFTCQGKFYVLRVNNKKNELVLHYVDENGIAGHKNISVDLNGFNRDKLSLSEYFSYSHVFYPKQETKLLEATDLTKIYPNSNKVVIIVVNDKEPPHVWNIDLQSYQATKQKFDLSGFSGFNEKKESFHNNSYLFGENLYVLNVAKQKIEIGIFNFSSGKLLKKHEINESSNIQFVETPVEIRTKGRFTKKNVINSNKELIKEMFKGSNGIAIARNANGEIILTCGIYDKETGTLYDGAFKESPFSTTGTYTKVISLRNNAGIRSYTITRTVNFKLILDSSKYNLVSSNSQISTVDKINLYIKSMPVETEATNIFRINGHYYLGYYSPKEKTFFVKEMEK